MARRLVRTLQHLVKRVPSLRAARGDVPPGRVREAHDQRLAQKLAADAEARRNPYTF
jgi:hypothetical protein